MHSVPIFRKSCEDPPRCRTLATSTIPHTTTLNETRCWNPLHFWQLKNGKAPGLDGIEIKILELRSKSHIFFLCSLINSIMKLHYFPNKWKLATVVCLLKCGKSPSDSSSYIPIRLLSSLSKAEKISQMPITSSSTLSTAEESLRRFLLAPVWCAAGVRPSLAQTNLQ